MLVIPNAPLGAAEGIAEADVAIPAIELIEAPEPLIVDSFIVSHLSSPGVIEPRA